ncbi:uncharacterized protein LOC115474261 isoform X2 [Microcaecilia unicolor]|uniref:Uncharacterized protein LOC115474261 isoform X2 n=1 Tax=Microcaecilia unicolor TaxID=1415580 RepID=A0A6P7YDF6_9AMPH|nr:uncharacterized protein LOC115474261 isoform X2 [Microcaecilia unicolor]
MFFAYRWLRNEDQSRPEPTAAHSEQEQRRPRTAQPPRTPALRQADDPAGDVTVHAFDVPDASTFKTESTIVRQALLKVLESAYLWFFPPVPNASKSYKLQPLYQLVVEEFSATIDSIKQKTEHVRGPRLVLILICVLTEHLQQGKQNTGQARGKIFQTPERKVDFLRQYTKLCTDNWLPASLLESKLFSLFLNEILTLKVLDQVLSMLSDPNSFNQMVINVLDPEAPEEEPASMEQEVTQPNEDTDVRSMNEDETVAKPKKKGKNRIAPKKKESGWKRPSRRSEDKSGIHFRTLCSDQGNEMWEAENETEQSREQKRKSEILGYEDLETKQCWTKLLCKLWKTDNMKVKVINVQFPEDPGEGESILCSIRIEDKDDPEDGLWTVNNTLDDFLHLQDKLGFPALEKIPLKSILELHKLEDNAGIQRAEKLLNTFLQELVTLIQTLENMDACLFLCPLEGPEEDWDDFRDILLELLCLVSDDDLQLIQCKTDAAVANGSKYRSPMEDHRQHTNSSEKYEVPAELAAASFEPGYTKPRVRKRPHLKSPGTSSSPAKRGLTRKSEDEGPVFRSLTNDDEKSPSQSIGKIEDVKMVLNNLKDHPQPLTMAVQRFLKEICKESFVTGSLSRLAASVRVITKRPSRKVEKFLEEKCDEYLSESKLASYVDKLREILWCNERPAAAGLEQTLDMKERMKAKSETLLSRITFAGILPSFASVTKRIKLEPRLHNIFQDAEDNERLIYMCLFYLSEELIPGLGQSLDVPWLKIKD